MFAVLRNSTYARLFGAQIIALLGTGLLTVALGLLAFDIAGGDAGIVMGVAMTIKMVAYVAVAPLAAALLARLPRRPVLIGTDLIRAGVAVSLPFVTEAYQVYILIFLLQSASATFTPIFQSVIPAVLPNESEYTNSLSLSRLAYDLEALVSPALAAALLTVTSYHNLFVGTVIGFLVSAVLVATSRLPRLGGAASAGFLDRLACGVKAFWRSRELRGLMAINLVVAVITAMVIINTVVLVQGELGRSATDAALILGAYGAGSMVVALSMPKVLGAFPDRGVMLVGAICLPAVLLLGAGVMAWPGSGAQWIALVLVWTLLGAASSMILTPSARLLRRNSTEQTRAAVFAAQFSLSHAWFLLAYPLAGALGAVVGLPIVALILVAIGVLGAGVCCLTWARVPRHDITGWTNDSK